MRDYFAQIDVSYFHLSSLFAVPFRGTKRFTQVLRAFESVDERLFKLEFFKRQAWQVVIELSARRESLAA
jgi:hypothetical protein